MFGLSGNVAAREMGFNVKLLNAGVSSAKGAEHRKRIIRVLNVFGERRGRYIFLAKAVR